MVREFCAKCNSLTNMITTESERTEKDSDGNDMKIVTNSYHCDKCHTFVKSEDIVKRDEK